MLITNVTANNASNAQRSMEKTIGKLTSGKRINSAADDAAGLNFSSKTASLTKSISQAVRNINHGIGFLNTVNAVYEEQYDIIVRARQLALQNMNDTYTDDDRALNNTEFLELLTSQSGEFDRLGRAAEYNEITGFLSNPLGDITFQIGIDSNVDSRMVIEHSDIYSIGKSYTHLKNITHPSQIGIETQIKSEKFVDGIDSVLNAISSKMSFVGARINRLEHSLSGLSHDFEAKTITASRIMDADYATESSKMTRDKIKFNASTAALGQAKSMKSSTISLIS